MFVGLAPRARSGAPPKIVVVCVFDQMRGDYLDRFAAGFGDAGFRRLLGNGVRYTNCNYPYAETETGPGHTTIGTGRLPRHHGIVANDWFDAAASRPIYCFADPDAKLVGLAGPVPGRGCRRGISLGKG